MLSVLILECCEKWIKGAGKAGFFNADAVGAHCGCCCHLYFSVRVMMLAAATGPVIAEFAVGCGEVAKERDVRAGKQSEFRACCWGVSGAG
ncbi:hypothetical protein RRG08_001769 [Elysia crispata]|uniref:Uncharacterized protein n=1 Tax=Elysia crispata TaxID=231223 RepID=A0AAE1AKM0_9GAST|nr:hypothetical protein RRG08_001769 [Elysia crispata]